jgi:hypothetical protein
MLTVNCAVGADKIGYNAKEAIARAGGTIEATKNPDVSMVKLPEDTAITSPGGENVYLHLPTEETLLFTREWHEKDCSLSLIP